MALVNCPECRKKVSDQCGNCPKCGYPIKTDSLLNPDDVSNVNCDNGSGIDKEPAKTGTPIIKRVWIWIVAASVLLAAVSAVVILINGETKPKLDKNGNPVFVELTDSVYFNAEDYLGYHVVVKGKVFQNVSDNGETKGIQVWIDPDNCQQNLMINYTTEDSVEDGDYIICTGYIQEIRSYNNAFGTELSVPLVYSTDLRKTSYIEVMAPTTSTITSKKLSYEKYGYSITVDKVEFAETETRVYLTATNNGDATLFVDSGSSMIVQGGRQYSPEMKNEPVYEELPYKISKGATASGMVVFPAISEAEFDYVIEVHSNDYDEKFKAITFRINKGASDAFVSVVEPNAIWDFGGLKYETKGYAIVIEKAEFYEDETRIYLSASNQGKATLRVDSDESLAVQNKKQYTAEYLYDADYEELPYSIAQGATATGAISLPAMETTEFKYIIEIHSDNFSEEFEPVVFVLNADSPSCQNRENEAWRLSVIINSEPRDEKVNKSSISKYDPLYVHMQLQGGKLGEKILIKYELIWNGEKQNSRVFDDSYGVNEKAIWGWEKGLFEKPETAKGGTLELKFYNSATDEQIGKASVIISN